ncbi:GlcG/HbpS family heme-binding protein [Streptomyces sp. NPDC003032]
MVQPFAVPGWQGEWACHRLRSREAWHGRHRLRHVSVPGIVLLVGQQAPMKINGIENSNGDLISFGGGVPIMDTDGRMVGAVGVSGGAADQDVRVAEAAVKAY